MRVPLRDGFAVEVGVGVVAGGIEAVEELVAAVFASQVIEGSPLGLGSGQSESVHFGWAVAQ